MRCRAVYDSRYRQQAKGPSQRCERACVRERAVLMSHVENCKVSRYNQQAKGPGEQCEKAYFLDH